MSDRSFIGRLCCRGKLTVSGPHLSRLMDLSSFFSRPTSCSLTRWKRWHCHAKPQLQFGHIEDGNVDTASTALPAHNRHHSYPGRLTSDWQGHQYIECLQNYTSFGFYGTSSRLWIQKASFTSPSTGISTNIDTQFGCNHYQSLLSDHTMSTWIIAEPHSSVTLTRAMQTYDFWSVLRGCSYLVNLILYNCFQVVANCLWLYQALLSFRAWSGLPTIQCVVLLKG